MCSCFCLPCQFHIKIQNQVWKERWNESNCSWVNGANTPLALKVFLTLVFYFSSLFFKWISILIVVPFRSETEITFVFCARNWRNELNSRLHIDLNGNADWIYFFKNYFVNWRWVQFAMGHGSWLKVIIMNEDHSFVLKC